MPANANFTSVVLRTFYIAIFSFLVGFDSAGQDLTDDLSFLRGQLQSHDTKPSFRIRKHETNEIKMGVQVFFLFYKSFLSSQDNQNCSFTPSCSVYCLHAIQERGVTTGLMSAFDRLSRCNYLSPENYQIDYTTGRLIDPVVVQDP